MRCTFYSALAFAAILAKETTAIAVEEEGLLENIDDNRALAQTEENWLETLAQTDADAEADALALSSSSSSSSSNSTSSTSSDDSSSSEDSSSSYSGKSKSSVFGPRGHPVRGQRMLPGNGRAGSETLGKT